MPWKIFKRADEFCVFKIDPSDKPIGDTLGCHPTVEKAQAQLGALNANVKEADIKLPIEFVQEFCPECAQQMREGGITQVALTEELADKVIKFLELGKSDPGFFKRCMKAPFNVKDKEAFCAFLHKKVIGIFPSQHQADDGGVFEGQKILRNAIKFHEQVAIAPHEQSEKLVPGSVWEITILKTGKSKSPTHYYYSQEAITKAVKVFEGVNVYANRAAPHVEPSEKSVQDAVGWISHVQVLSGSLVGRLNILPSANWLRENLLAANAHGKLDLYELSIDAAGSAYPREVEGETLPYVESIDHVEGVDVVPRGAAGGAFNKLVASMGGTTMKEKLLEILKESAPQFFKDQNIDAEKLTDADAAKLFKEAMDYATDAARKEAEAKLKKAEEDKGKDDLTKRLEEMEKKSSQTLLAAKLIQSELPAPLQEAIRKRFEGKSLQEVEIDQEIKATRETYAKFTQASPDSKGLDVKMGQTDYDKVALGILGFFLENPNSLNPLKPEERKEILKGIPPYESFKAAYVDFTGDTDITGQKKRMRFTEAITTTDFAQVVADALNKKLVREYAMLNLNTWQTFTDIVRLVDFKTQHRIRMGGYPNLATVAEKAAYPALASPTDEEATYSPTKRGGTEEITREVIMNDDVGAISRIPGRMARAAGQTLHEFVFAFIDPNVNANIYDANPLYDAAHSNTATTALDTSGVQLQAARLRMKVQTQLDNSKRLGLRARYLVVPSDLEKTAYDNLTPAFGQSNTVPQFFQQLGISIIVVDYWTDATDWAVIADRTDIVGLEIGFVGGQQTPEIFVSDLANVGSWFTNDTITYKIRHEYGCAIIDWRAFDGSIVAG